MSDHSKSLETAKNKRPDLKLITPPSGMDKLRRLIWLISWACLARWTPVPLHNWRKCLARLFGARIGQRATLYPSVSIWAPWNLEMADNSCLAEGVRCYNVAKVTLGKDSIVSQYAYLCTASHDPHDPEFPLIGGPITLAEGAWVAAEAFVSPGVTLQERAVAAARAVIVRDVEPWTIVGGNPARVLGKRGSAAIAELTEG